MRFAWVCLAVALATGCETGTGNNELGVCSTLCRCAAGALPSEQSACIEACLDIASFTATRECEACVFENVASCTRMEQLCFATTVCGGSDPEPDPVPPNDDL